MTMAATTDHGSTEPMDLSQTTTAGFTGNPVVIEQHMTPEERFNKRAQELAMQHGWNLGKAKRALKAVSRKNTKKLKKRIAKAIKRGQFRPEPPGIDEEQVQALEAAADGAESPEESSSEV